MRKSASVPSEVALIQCPENAFIHFIFCISSVDLLLVMIFKWCLLFCQQQSVYMKASSWSHVSHWKVCDNSNILYDLHVQWMSWAHFTVQLWLVIFSIYFFVSPQFPWFHVSHSDWKCIVPWKYSAYTWKGMVWQSHEAFEKLYSLFTSFI